MTDQSSRARPVEIGIRDGVTVRVVRREAERLVDARFELLGDHVLQEVGRALRALARREHSRAELRARLETHAETPEELDGLLDELEKRGWLSEQRFVEQLTTVRRRKFGADRIIRELREKGVSGEALEASRADRCILTPSSF